MKRVARWQKGAAFHGSNLHKDTKKKVEITRKSITACKRKINSKRTRKLSLLPTDEIRETNAKGFWKFLQMGLSLCPKGERERERERRDGGRHWPTAALSCTLFYY